MKQLKINAHNEIEIHMRLKVFNKIDNQVWKRISTQLNGLWDVLLKENSRIYIHDITPNLFGLSNSSEGTNIKRGNITKYL